MITFYSQIPILEYKTWLWKFLPLFKCFLPRRNTTWIWWNEDIWFSNYQNNSTFLPSITVFSYIAILSYLYSYHWISKHPASWSIRRFDLPAILGFWELPNFISTASITALTKLLFVAIDTTSYKELPCMEGCHNSIGQRQTLTVTHGRTWRHPSTTLNTISWADPLLE